MARLIPVDLCKDLHVVMMVHSVQWKVIFTVKKVQRPRQMWDVEVAQKNGQLQED